ncbi:MAG TPA: 3-deoxy-manno-octulosonate cytidylyltransferase [Saprospiraceae bacterium]|nr:3-deoxy-manno-octulosonate cytidylyltransferase [Saprospiraceae bacterium]HMQ84503.1 3-deoxy-manno-octulosonate cytidylyltransferase [Saprospiraceae bacterium]
MKTLAIIPARFASTRFPGKPLVEIQGKSMVQRVYEQASKASLVAAAVVATDDTRIFEHVLQFGGQAMMTDPSHASGTDRCAEVAAHYPDTDYFVNVQGDEPFIQPEQIDLALEPLLRKNQNFSISTLAKAITHGEDIWNPNVVKVVFGHKGQALYFSRSAIPHIRGVEQVQWLQQAVFYKHIGLYAFTRQALLEVSQLEKGRYEQAESLEQLRWLEQGYAIHVGITALETIGIDTPEDLSRLDTLNF